MTARDAAILMFVGLGIFAGITAAAFLQSSVLGLLFDTGFGGASRAFRLLLLLPSAMLAWLAVTLVRDRARRAHELFPEDGAAADAPRDAGARIGREDLQRLGVILIGSLVVVRAAPGFVQWAVANAGTLLARAPLFDAGGGWAWLSGASYAFVDLALGAAILQKSESVRRFLFERDAIPSD